MSDRRFSNSSPRRFPFPSTRAATLLLALTGGASSALAQAPAQDQEPIEEIFVTGSRLATTGLDTASPVTVISSDEIAFTNLSSTGELLRELPLSGAQSATETAGRGNSGVATAALRGLSAVNTLVLMNGRRLLAQNDQGEVDLNSLPFEAIERIEILQDGASAVYGSDAIAGVVNLIMRDSYDGLALEGYYGVSERGDANLANLALTFGAEFERGGFVFVANHREQDGYLIADRPCCRDADQRSMGGANLRDPLPVPASVKGLDSNDPTAEFIIREGLMQATTLDDFRPFINNFLGPPAPDDAFNYFEFESSMSDSTLDNFWFNGFYDLTSNVTGFVEVASNRRDSFSFLAPDAFGEVFGDPIFLHPNNDFNPFGVELSVARTIIEQGAENVRQQNVDSHTQRMVVGVRGELGDPRGSDWTWELSYNTQRLDDFRFAGNVTSRTRLQQAAGDSDECRAAANGCVPINLLGAPGTISQEMLDFILIPAFTDREASLDSFQLNVTGTAFSMPAGDVQLAIGAEYREEGFHLINDSFRNAGDVIFSGTTADANPPDRRVRELYVETSVPVIESFDLDFALRYSDFSQFGTTTNPKVGLRWRLGEDWLLRGSYGTGFRAPNFEEAFGGQSRGFRNITDPCEGPDFAQIPGCNGMQAPVVTGAFVVSGGNPDLEPETADNYTLGVVWTPSNVEGLSMTLDAFRIEKEDVISSADVNFIIDQHVRFGLFPGQVIRDANHRIQDVIALLGNIGEQRVQGFDFGVDYETPEYSIGSFGATLDLTYLDEFSLSPAPGIPATNRVGIYETALGTVAELRANTSIRWFRDEWSAVYTNRYVDGVTNVDGFATSMQNVDSYLQHDLSISYALDEVADGTVLTFGIENLLDEDPPFVEGNFQNGFDQGTFNSRGRYYFLKARIRL
jgi:iron complex outermembrane receptor protein